MKNELSSIAGILVSVCIGIAVAVAGSQGGLVVNGIPLLIVLGIVAFVVQWVAFVPAFAFQTEKYFDGIGSMTYIGLALSALFFSNMEPGSILIAAMVIIWAARLGSFLFIRIQRDGHDRRFDSIKPDFLQFLMTWTIQGLWVLLTFSAGLSALTSGNAHPIDGVVIFGTVLWTTGFAIEVVADRQKSEFKKDPSNKDKFICHGLWSWSRHPNYFGEIVLWTGVALVASPVLVGWQYVTLISPLFVLFLLTKVSGVRMLENKARKKWGDNPDYIEYRHKTPMLWSNPLKRPHA